MQSLHAYKTQHKYFSEYHFARTTGFNDHNKKIELGANSALHRPS